MRSIDVVVVLETDHEIKAASMNTSIDAATVRNVHLAINSAHRFVYFVPEAAEEYAALGVNGFGGYFGSRAAPLGPVPAEVVLATFYNFSPLAVSAGMANVWNTAEPAALQAARFRVVDRALERVGVSLSLDAIAEARSLIDPVVAGLDLAGKPLAAANAAVVLPDDSLVALWQQVTVLREWRGDVHIALLVTNELGPCDCMVVQVGTGRFPLALTQASRQWNEQEWAAAIVRLAERGWVDAEGAMTAAGIEARERIEVETDRLCAPIWQPIGGSGTARLTQLLAPITAS